MNKHNLDLVRSDLGDGGWSLHDAEGKLLLDGAARWVADRWNRPNQADYDAARRLETAQGRTNHPNRARDSSPPANPKPATIREVRRAHALTPAQCGALVFSTPRAWQRWESGDSRMHPAIWQWFRHQLFSRRPHLQSDTTPLRLDLTHLEIAQLQTLIEKVPFAPYGGVIIKILEALQPVSATPEQINSELPDCMLLRRQAE